MRKRFLLAGMALLGLVFIFQGCSKKAESKDKVIVSVNGENIYVKDFSRMLSINLRRDPMFRVTPNTLEDEVNTLIDKRLLLQEARKNKLDQTERFTNTIKTFWEQTLIRDLMGQKDKELSRMVSATDKEALAYYEKAMHQKTFRVIKSKDKEKIAKAMAMSPEKVDWDETVGPVTYGDLSAGLINEAFDTPKGKVKALKGKDVYYLFYVVADDVLPLAPFEEIKADIKQKIIETKKAELFDKWVYDIRKKSKVEVNENVLKGLKYRND